MPNNFEAISTGTIFGPINVLNCAASSVLRFNLAGFDSQMARKRGVFLMSNLTAKKTRSKRNLL